MKGRILHKLSFQIKHSTCSCLIQQHKAGFIIVVRRASNVDWDTNETSDTELVRARFPINQVHFNTLLFPHLCECVRLSVYVSVVNSDLARRPNPQKPHSTSLSWSSVLTKLPGAQLCDSQARGYATITKAVIFAFKQSRSARLMLHVKGRWTNTGNRGLFVHGRKEGR